MRKATPPTPETREASVVTARRRTKDPTAFLLKRPKKPVPSVLAVGIQNIQAGQGPATSLPRPKRNTPVQELRQEPQGPSPIACPKPSLNSRSGARRKVGDVHPPRLCRTHLMQMRGRLAAPIRKAPARGNVTELGKAIPTTASVGPRGPAPPHKPLLATFVDKILRRLNAQVAA